jgi:alpha-beta hydrolase superfamily lysophospholipase
MLRRVALSGLLAGLALVTPVSAQTEPTRLTVVADGHPLVVWARVPAAPRAALILVHGRTWSSRPDFDLQVPGLQRSVMRSLAAQGIAAYAVDLRGYGGTPRDSTGFLTPRRAAADVGAVVRFVAARHPALPAPALLGWSLGGAVAHLAAQSPDVTVSSLILFGFITDPELTFADVAAPEKPAYAKTTRADALSDFISPAVTSPNVQNAFAAQALAADPVRVDWTRTHQWGALDPAQVRVPTLVLHGERDPLAPAEAQAALFQGLGTPDRAWVVIPGGDHAAFLESPRSYFLAVVDAFLRGGAALPGRQR